MALLRHRQRAITAVSGPGTPNAPWINPSKRGAAADPTDNFEIPAVYFFFDAITATPASWRPVGEATDPDYDSSGQFRFSVKFWSGSARAGTNKLLFSQSSTNKRVQLHDATKQVRWIDNSITTNFAVNWDYDTWYRLDIETVADKLNCTLYNLPEGTIAGQDSVTAPAGINSGNTRPFIGGEAAVPTIGHQGGMAQLRWYEGGTLKHHWPITEGVGASTLDVIRNNPTNASTGTGSHWIPDAVHAGWVGWIQQGAGWTGGTTSALISQAQFKAETGENAPVDHRGDILKITMASVASVPIMRLTVADDPSTWTSWQPRFYISDADFEQISQPGEGGQVVFRMRANTGNVNTRALISNVGGRVIQKGFNFPVFDPNDATWINLGGTGSFLPENYGVQHEGGYVPGPIVNMNVEPLLDSAGTAPIDIYCFDILRDTGAIEPIHVFLGFDDSTSSDFTEVDPILATHGLVATGFFQESAIDAGGMTTAQINSLAGNGRWAFGPHADVHVNYETLNALQVTTDIGAVRAAMITRGIDNTTTFIAGSKPQNGGRQTTDGVEIKGLEQAGGRSYSRRGFYGLYSERTGVPDNWRIGNLVVLGQNGPPTNPSAGTQVPTYARWAAMHTKAKALGMSYGITGHIINGAPSGGLEFLNTDLDLICADLAADVAAGTTVVHFFGDWCDIMKKRV